MKNPAIKQCQANYKRLLALLPDVQKMESGTAVKLKADQFMDLCIDVIMQQGTVTQISMAHYYKQNGDLVPDPDMEVMLMHVTRMALPVHFQNAFAYRVCIEGTKVINSKEMEDQSAFLSMWLRNLKAQGHALKKVDPA